MRWYKRDHLWGLWDKWYFPLNCSGRLQVNFRPRSAAALQVLVPMLQTSSESGVHATGETLFWTQLYFHVDISDPLRLDFPILATCSKVAAETLDHWATKPELFSRQLLKDALRPEGLVTLSIYSCVGEWKSSYAKRIIMIMFHRA